MSSRAKELFDTSVDQVRQGKLRGALITLLDALADDPTHAPSLEASGRLCRILGATDEAQLFEAVHEDPEALEARHKLAYHLVDEGRPDVAIGLLELGLAGVEPGPAEAGLRRELAFAQLRNRDFEASLRSLAPLEHMELADPELIDTHLLQAECAVYLGRRGLSQAYLDRAEALVPDDDQRASLDGLHALHGRARHFEKLTDLDVRAWHFVQHGGVLLKTAGGFFEDGSLAGRFEMLDLRIDMVAFLLQRTVDLLAWAGISYEVVIPTGEVAAPLASALARRLGIEMVESLPDRAGRSALLVATNAAEYGPLVAGLARHRRELGLFAINLDWTRDAPVCPEIVGVLAQRSFLPWETRYSVDPGTGETRETGGDARPADELGAELLAAMDALPDDGGVAHEEFLAHYAELREELVLGNDQLVPHRRRFTHVSPAWTRLGPQGQVVGNED